MIRGASKTKSLPRSPFFIFLGPKNRCFLHQGRPEHTKTSRSLQGPYKSDFHLLSETHRTRWNLIRNVSKTKSLPRSPFLVSKGPENRCFLHQGRPEHTKTLMSLQAAYKSDFYLLSETHRTRWNLIRGVSKTKSLPRSPFLVSKGPENRCFLHQGRPRHTKTSMSLQATYKSDFYLFSETPWTRLNLIRDVSKTKFLPKKPIFHVYRT